MSNEPKSLKRKALHAGGWQVVRRVAKSIPYIGSVLAIGLVGHDIKKKGLFRGVLNSGLDAIPIIGTVKNVAELVRGDFIPDKQSALENRIEVASEPAAKEKKRK